MHTSDTVYVAGSNTLIGAALERRLKTLGYEPLADDGLDLNDAQRVADFFNDQQPDYVFVAAGESGGIAYNQNAPATLMLDNLRSSINILQSAAESGVGKLLYLGSSCMYPRLAPQPMHPDSLMTGPLEPTNDAYAMAKIAGMTLASALRREHGAQFMTGIPANNYGPGDDFSEENAHVVGALLRRIHAAKMANDPTVVVWGSGAPRREFVFVDDLADACIFAMQHYTGTAPLNIGSGEDVSIRELAEMIAAVVGYDGRLTFDTARPDGMPLKALDSSVLQGLGWQASVALQAGLEQTYSWYINQLEHDIDPA